MAKTILESYFGRAYNLEILARSAATDIQATMKLDLDQDEYAQLVKSITPIVKTPISDFFSRAVAADSHREIFYISTVKNNSGNVPELLSINDLTILGKDVQVKMPDEMRKAWAHITTCISLPKTDRLGDLQVTASNDLMSIVDRCVLCTSYSTMSGDWLPGKSSEFLIDVYAKMMSMIVSRIYGLDVEEGVIVKFAFAYYMASLMTTERDANNAPMIINRCNTLFKYGKIDFNKLIEKMTSLVGEDTMSMKYVSQFIVANGPDRIKDFTEGNIYRALMTSSRNSIASLIAADYPPYMLYLLLRIISNDKHPILTNILNKQFTRSQINDEIKLIINHKPIYNIGTKG